MLHRVRVVALLVAAACGGGGSRPGPAPAPAVPSGTPVHVAAAASSGGVGSTGRVLPSVVSRHHVFLRATVGGVPALLLFDSGASATILSPRLVQRLGLAYRARHLAYGIGEPVARAHSYEGVEIRIGGVQVRPEVVLSWTDAAFPPYGTTLPDGVIGYDLLRAFVVLVDALGGRVVVLDSAAPPPPRRRGAREVAMRVRSGLPVIDADVFAPVQPAHPAAPGVSVPLVIDFGAGAGVHLSRAASERLGLPGRLRDTRTRQLIGIGGAVETAEGVADSVRIAGVAVPEVLVAADTTETASVALAEAEGLVGTEILRRFIVTLDYARGRALFEPNPLLRAPFCRNAAGICVRNETAARGVEVAFVDPGSTGARGGIRAGNLILAVDGVSVAQLSIPEVDRLLDHGPGAVLEIVRNPSQLRASLRADGAQRSTGGGRSRIAALPPPRDQTNEIVRLPPE